MRRLTSALVLLAALVTPAIGRGPDEEVAQFLKQFKDPNANNFAKAQFAEEIGKRADRSKVAVPALMELLKDPQNAQYVAQGLGAAGPAAKEAVGPLLAILKDPAQFKAHGQIISAIGKIKPPDPKAFIEAITPILTEPKEGQDFALRQAIEALGQIGPGAKAAATLLYPLIKDKKPRHAALVLKTLGLIQADPLEALPAVAPYLTSRDRGEAREAERAYLRLAPDNHPEAKAIQERLITLLKDTRNGGRRGEAIAALQDLGPVAKFAVPALIEDIEGPNAILRNTSREVLVKIGPGAKGAIPAILKAAGDKANWEFGGLGRTLDAIPQIGGKNTDQLPILIAVIEDYVAPDGMYHPKPKAFPRPFQGEVIARIKALGPDGVEAAAAVAKLVEYHQVNREGGQSIIIQAMETLGEMGPGAKAAALPVLLKSKGDFTADQAIKKITDPNVAVKPKDPLDKPKDPLDKPKDPVKPVVDEEKTKALIAGLKDPAKRKQAILDIAALGIEGRAAQPALVEMLRDPDREIRLLAAYALEKLESAK
jgi:HEAT repeat protein